LGKFGLTVSPLRLIAKTARNLEVTVNATDHQELFQLLR
jgi:hypothetical protein